MAEFEDPVRDSAERERDRQRQELAAEEARQRELLAKAQAEDRRRREQESQRQMRQLAMHQARQKAGRAASQATKQAARAGAQAARTALAAAGEAVGSFLAAAAPVILVILIIVGIILFVIVTVVVMCNSSGWTGRFARLASTAGAAVGILDQNYCKTFEGLTGVSQTLSNIQVPPPGGTTCDLTHIQPIPAGAVLDCSQCVNLATYGIPLKNNPWADPSMANLLNLLYQKNKTFRVTEAFCPTSRHTDPKHYNGKAVDINVLPAYAGNKPVIAQLYKDAASFGFTNILCEYPAHYLDDFGVTSCGAVGTTEGDNIHLDGP